MKIRFLTLSPQQFAEGPGKSTLLSESEKFAILMNICTPNAAVPMPEGFSTSTTPRRRKKSINDPFNLVSRISVFSKLTKQRDTDAHNFASKPLPNVATGSVRIILR